MITIINILKSIGSLIVSLVNFLISTFRSLLYLLSQIPNFINFLNISVSVLPTIIIPFVIASISIYVIYLILGRN